VLCGLWRSTTSCMKRVCRPQLHRCCCCYCCWALCQQCGCELVQLAVRGLRHCLAAAGGSGSGQPSAVSPPAVRDSCMQARTHLQCMQPWQSCRQRGERCARAPAPALGAGVACCCLLLLLLVVMLAAGGQQHQPAARQRPGGRLLTAGRSCAGVRRGGACGVCVCVEPCLVGAHKQVLVALGRLLHTCQQHPGRQRCRRRCVCAAWRSAAAARARRCRCLIQSHMQPAARPLGCVEGVDELRLC
jgi:hypothetical protein